MKVTLLAGLVAVFCIATPRLDAQIVNGSFETGDFTGWTSVDILGPFYPQSVSGPGFSPWGGFFLSTPTDGSFAAVNGFDGTGPGVIRLHQDALIDQAQLAMDIRAAADLALIPAILPRTFSVIIEPAGGGPPLQTDDLFTATPGVLLNDSGSLAVTVDVSAFRNTTVRVVLEWDIPESFSGPGFFQVDNIRLESGPGPVLSLSAACPGPVTLNLDDSAPFAIIGLAFGPAGSFTIAGGSCPGTLLDIGSPTLAGIFSADATGSLSFGVTLPPALCGLTLQAVDLTGCLVSNPVVL